MYSEQTSYCRACNRLITFVRTKAGKMMPCQPDPVPYIEDERGDEQLLTRDGRLVRCRIVREKGGCDGFGYIPHFAKCVSKAGQKRLAAYEKQKSCGVGEFKSSKPKAPPTEEKKKAAAPEPQFEQLCIFPSGERVYRHPK